MAAYEELQNRFDDAEDISIALPTGESLAARCYGPEDADMFVLALHGYLDNSATFARLAPVLAAAREPSLRVVCLDFIGHGRSDHAASHEYALLTYVQHTVHVARALGWKTFALMGHSMGGHVAFYVAALLGAAVSHLVLIDAPLFALVPSALPGGLLKAIDDRAVRFEKTWQEYSSRELMVTKFIDSLARTGQRVLDREAARLIVERGSVQLPSGGFRFTHDLRLKLHALFHFSREQRDAFLAELQARVLFVVAAGGPFVRYVGVVRKRHPADVLELEGSHHVHLDDPQYRAIAERVRAHLSLARSAL